MNWDSEPIPRIPTTQEMVAKQLHYDIANQQTPGNAIAATNLPLAKEATIWEMLCEADDLIQRIKRKIGR